MNIAYNTQETLEENVARYCRYRTHKYYEWAKKYDVVESDTEVRK